VTTSNSSEKDLAVAAERAAALEESVQYFSSSNKTVREQWVASTFLENLGIPHTPQDLVPPDCDPPDVKVFECAFEIKEILGCGRRRHDEYRQELERAKSANALTALPLASSILPNSMRSISSLTRFPKTLCKGPVEQNT
jgi:hypothetical protein